jgi:hypothetical protein
MSKVRDKKARSLAENVLVREYFDNQEKGFFVEVGANDPTHHGSQTWHLEKKSTLERCFSRAHTAIS